MTKLSFITVWDFSCTWHLLVPFHKLHNQAVLSLCMLPSMKHETYLSPEICPGYCESQVESFFQGDACTLYQAEFQD